MSWKGGFQGSGGGGASALTVMSSFISGNVSLSQNTPANLTNLSLAAGTWIIWYKAYPSLPAGAGVTIWIGTTSASTTGGIASSSAAQNTGAFGWLTPNGFVSVTPSVLTTYYLNAQSGATGTTTVEAQDGNSLGIGKQTGMLALKVA